MKTYALIVAGGSGTRMGASMPKQFLPVHGKPLFLFTVRAFHKAVPEGDIILVLPAEYIDKGRAYLDAHLPGVKVQLVAGGDTRFHSVHNGLSAIQGDGIVMVHDAVRCMVSGTLIQRCLRDVAAHGSSVPVVAVKDSIRMLEGEGSRALDRSLLRAVQTPQCFSVEALKKVFQLGYQPVFTDEASVWESAGHSVFLTEGEETNMKVTYPPDLSLAEQFLAGQEGALFFD